MAFDPPPEHHHRVRSSSLWAAEGSEHQAYGSEQQGHLLRLHTHTYIYSWYRIVQLFLFLLPTTSSCDRVDDSGRKKIIFDLCHLCYVWLQVTDSWVQKTDSTKNLALSVVLQKHYPEVIDYFQSFYLYAKDNSWPILLASLVINTYTWRSNWHVIYDTRCILI